MMLNRETEAPNTHLDCLLGPDLPVLCSTVFHFYLFFFKILGRVVD